jgi:hypothetical protein
MAGTTYTCRLPTYLPTYLCSTIDALHVAMQSGAEAASHCGALCSCGPSIGIYRHYSAATNVFVSYSTL